MSYIGNQPPDTGAYDVESFNGGGTSFTLKRAATTPSILLFIDGVRQTPTDAYSVSGVTLTTTATTPSGTDNVTVMFMGDVVDIGTPSADTVSTAKIQDDAVTAAKLANSINTEIAANTAKVTNATHTGDVTGATALTIAADAVDIAMLSATGTADATTFLRGDNAWATAGGDNTPSFFVRGTGTQAIADQTWTKVTWSTEVWDTDSAFASDKFTVPSGESGKYFFTYGGCMSEVDDGEYSHTSNPVRIYVVNGEGLPPGESWTSTVEYINGWNIVGLSANVQDNSVGVIFPDHTSGTLYDYNETYVQQSELIPGRGYWLYFEDAGSSTYLGAGITQMTLTLNEGWNLISGISEPVFMASLNDPEGIVIPGSLYGFDGQYQYSSVIEPGKG